MPMSPLPKAGTQVEIVTRRTYPHGEYTVITRVLTLIADAAHPNRSGTVFFPGHIMKFTADPAPPCNDTWRVVPAGDPDRIERVARALERLADEIASYGNAPDALAAATYRHAATVARETT